MDACNILTMDILSDYINTEDYVVETSIVPIHRLVTVMNPLVALYTTSYGVEEVSEVISDIFKMMVMNSTVIDNVSIKEEGQNGTDLGFLFEGPSLYRMVQMIHDEYGLEVLRDNELPILYGLVLLISTILKESCGEEIYPFILTLEELDTLPVPKIVVFRELVYDKDKPLITTYDIVYDVIVKK